MSRVKAGKITRTRHKKILKRAKGYFGRRKNTFKVANQGQCTDSLWYFFDFGLFACDDTTNADAYE